ncbi:MAG: potassium transporter Kup [Gammaproteobacteria bacterium]|jgi:KUP system potassium uptake protein
MRHGPGQPPRERIPGLALAALGIVYGDIGTSPLYAFRECFHGAEAVPLNPGNVLGVLSLIFWSLIIVISVKYLTFVMRADNRGEGGILALLALVSPKRQVHRRWLVVLIWMGVFGAALLYGDGMITPAISVLSAVEGLEVAAPQLQPWVVPITVVILTALFWFQHRGTARVGATFGPIMLVWFTVLAALGLWHIVETPEVLRALWPGYATRFFMHNGTSGYLVLGAVFLVVTGGEALYADMGHFGRKPIRLAWFVLVLPALALNYFGQGAMLLADPRHTSHPFFHLAPGWALYPLLVLSTLATIIASQAIISGAFSLTRQAMQLGDVPRMRMHQTSSRMIGQIYIPGVNWVLYVATVALVIGFGSSSALAAAYGVAVTTTMVITTVLAFVVARSRGGWNLWRAGSFLVVFLSVDIAFFGANIIKVPDGGWFPLVVGGGIFLLMNTWRRGSQLLNQRLSHETKTLEELIGELDEQAVYRMPGTAVFLTGDWEQTPVALNHHLKHNKVLAEKVILLTVITEDQPKAAEDRRIEVKAFAKGFYRVALHYGFMQGPNIPSDLVNAVDEGLIDADLEDATYYIGHRTLFAGKKKDSMLAWRERLFAFMARNAVHPTTFYRIPADQVVEIGVQVRL